MCHLAHCKCPLSNPWDDCNGWLSNLCLAYAKTGLIRMSVEFLFWKCMWVFPKIGEPPPQIIHFTRVFHYEPSILGVFPLFLETPMLRAHWCWQLQHVKEVCKEGDFQSTDSCSQVACLEPVNGAMDYSDDQRIHVYIYIVYKIDCIWKL